MNGCLQLCSPQDLYENACSIMTCRFADDPTEYFVVGTAYAMPDDPEPVKGRILVFSVQSEGSKLVLTAETEVKGACYTLNAFNNGKLLAGINSKITLYRWKVAEDGTKELEPEAGHHGHILALYVQSRGDFIVVGDLMKSISLLV